MKTTTQPIAEEAQHTPTPTPRNANETLSTLKALIEIKRIASNAMVEPDGTALEQIVMVCKTQIARLTNRGVL